MAAIPKISAETIEEVTGTIKKAVDESDVESVAKSLNLEVKDVQKLVKGKAPKGLISSVFEAAGGTVKTLQGKLDTALGRATPPPAVAQEFRTESLGKERGYTLQSPIGGPLVPARRGALTPLPENVEAEDIPTPPPTALTRVQQRVQEVEPTPPPVKQLQPPGRREELLSESLQEGQPGMEQLPEYNLGIGPSKRTVTRGGLGVAGAGTAVAGYRLLGDKPLAAQEGAGDTTRVAEVTGTPDVKAMTDKALPHLPEQAREAIQDQVQKVLSIEERLDKELSTARTAYNKEMARKELLQAIETVMHGLVTALGAKAALDRGSPFAIDFSKGPQVNWESKFANLQKDFELQTNSIVKKYNLEQKERLEQQKAIEGQRRYEDRMTLEREKLELEKAKAGQQQAEKQAKLTAAEQKQYNTNLKHYGDLRKAITEKKPGAAEDAAVLLGADETTLQNLKTAMNQGMWDKVLNTLGISESPTTEQVLQGLRPSKPAAAAPSDLDAKRRRMQELLEKQEKGQ